MKKRKKYVGNNYDYYLEKRRGFTLSVRKVRIHEMQTDSRVYYTLFDFDEYRGRWERMEAIPRLPTLVDALEWMLRWFDTYDVSIAEVPL